MPSVLSKAQQQQAHRREQAACADRLTPAVAPYAGAKQTAARSDSAAPGQRAQAGLLLRNSMAVTLKVPVPGPHAPLGLYRLPGRESSRQPDSCARRQPEMDGDDKKQAGLKGGNSAQSRKQSIYRQQYPNDPLAAPFTCFCPLGAGTGGDPCRRSRQRVATYLERGDQLWHGLHTCPALSRYRQPRHYVSHGARRLPHAHPAASMVPSLPAGSPLCRDCPRL